MISKAGGNGALVQTWFLAGKSPSPPPPPHNSLVEFPSLFNTLINTYLYYFKQGQKRVCMTQILVSTHKNIIYFFNTASTLQNFKKPRPICANRVSGGRLAPTAILNHDTANSQDKLDSWLAQDDWERGYNKPTLQIKVDTHHGLLSYWTVKFPNKRHTCIQFCLHFNNKLIITSSILQDKTLRVGYLNEV